MEITPNTATQHQVAAKIVVIGVGGGGNNAVNRMIEANVKSASFISVNTDMQALRMSTAPIRLQIGAKLTHGQGAGADPEVGQRAAEESKLAIREKIKDADMVFITAGMGGGTGTGAAPVIAALSKEMGKLTVAVVTKPFSFEGKIRMDHAEIGIANLRKNVDTLVVIPNEKLLKIAGNMTFQEAFRYADDVLRQGIQGISDVIMNSSMINLDFADIRTVMRNKGIAHMGIGRGKGEGKTVEAVKQAVFSPLLETSIEGATSVILHIMVGPDVRLEEVYETADLVKQVVAKDANIIFGSDIRPSIKDSMIVTIIATGLEGSSANAGTESGHMQEKDAPKKKIGIFGEDGRGSGFIGRDLDKDQSVSREFGKDALGGNAFSNMSDDSRPQDRESVKIKPLQSSRVEIDDDFPEFLRRLNQRK